MSTARSVVAWEGFSLLDSTAPIAVVLTGLGRASTNSKTGPMVQVYIIRTDKSPADAVRDGSDSAICGNCQHRSGSNIGRSCYVIYWNGPQAVYRSLPYLQRRKVYAIPELVGKGLRISAYGDAAAVPASFWFGLTMLAGWWTGYTSHWRTCDQRLRKLLMASVYDEASRAEAAKRGWRTFRTRRHGDSLAANTEVICPASVEAGHRTTCDECRLCRGTSLDARSVAILPHGQRVRWMREA